MARLLNLSAYIKSEDGTERLMQQVAFVARGQIWQGYKGALFLVRENQVSNEELLSYDDLDGTKEQVWKRRRERLDSRNQFKTQEYDKRRAQLRQVKNEIRAAIKSDKDLGLEPDPGDLDDIKKINDRMKRLVVLSAGEEFYVQEEVLEAVAAGEDVTQVKPRPRFDPADFACHECGKAPPLTAKNPKRWLNGHTMGSHKKVGNA